MLDFPELPTGDLQKIKSKLSARARDSEIIDAFMEDIHHEGSEREVIVQTIRTGCKSKNMYAAYRDLLRFLKETEHGLEIASENVGDYSKRAKRKGTY